MLPRVLRTVALLALLAVALAVPTHDPAAAAQPRLRVHPLVRGLDHPWDVRALPGGRLLITQRNRRALTVWRAGHQHRVRFANRRIWVGIESGLMGLQVDPAFRSNRRFYTCQGWRRRGGGHDVRVIAWRMGLGYRRATQLRTLVSGLPSTNGQHGGCRLLIARDGSMHVGTGDAKIGTAPENLGSLGGKTLRLNRFTGAPWPTNPFIRSSNPRTRYVFTYGHRNVQGLAQRADGTIWSVEQGTFRDDEVNLLVRGGDYGYNPVPGYNEQVPMTDHSLPGVQQSARWRSGNPTDATSGGTFLPSSGWGRLDGWMAVAALKHHELVLLHFDAAGHLLRELHAVRGRGRLRTAVVAPDGSLLVTTDNGGGRDVVLRVRPR
ncbi:PQQ-dependent sugar dehydrogenase [Nocardioides sp. CER19]|uniref:PQQ-dependent sugar dehydrogenase n=1 Tax=Nocardioides sp. CER19 TaxID=3038538 RepID=UPI002448DB14|nr:PQQ-dependent sugar dehydrogenase [Nocardioides sp. CER19]MDH2416087.1 PQQ-dependent sugar dehydrogenase [Nocardioides sp. CER19]